MNRRFQLRFPLREIDHWAGRYDDDDRPLSRISEAVKARRFLTKEEFLVICRWKSPRTRPRCDANPAPFVREVTRCALRAASERLRIEVLTLLDGVGWPTASVILHFFHREPYPILDFRALWSLGAEAEAPYRFAFWSGYTEHCRKLAEQAGVSMRTLDRALWQYSRENQA
ncbi:MAG: hypothetical protein H7A45_21000 [Verrucomicrobiales bacterium]|nr:hypothetical protein [Verrucomicrobiales bacterium]